MKAQFLTKSSLGLFLLALTAPIPANADGSANQPLPRFSRPREITNPYLPLSLLKQDILEGTEGGKSVRVVRTAKPDIRKVFQMGDQNVEAFTVEDREFQNGRLSEVTLDYFAQADDGTVYYLGEDVDEYKDGKIVGHEGAWLLGVQTQRPGVLMPAHPKSGQEFRSEDVPSITTEADGIVSTSASVKVPAGAFQNCVEIMEKRSEGGAEYKYYASGLGVVKEASKDGELLLQAHAAVGRSRAASAREAAQANPGPGSGANPPLQDSAARAALALVGMDPDAEAYWMAAINDPSLSAHERSDLIEDLNEDGLLDPKKPTLADLPVIENRLSLIEEIAPNAMDQVNADAFMEAYKDLLNLAEVARGRGQPVR